MIGHPPTPIEPQSQHADGDTPERGIRYLTTVDTDPGPPRTFVESYNGKRSVVRSSLIPAGRAGPVVRDRPAPAAARSSGSRDGRRGAAHRAATNDGTPIPVYGQGGRRGQ
ncbi:hypothetical protein Ais01nite_09900 [Asanoa ishikariensis]|nr:hypothetical protein Ais01nite_09900 [Asanoa ishikariensis]